MGTKLTWWENFIIESTIGTFLLLGAILCLIAYSFYGEKGLHAIILAMILVGIFLLIKSWVSFRANCRKGE